MTTQQLPRNSTAFPEYIVLAETEHYEVMFKSGADRFNGESDYFVVLKERSTIESRDRAFSIAMVHMYDAEALLKSIQHAQEGENIGNSLPAPVNKNLN
jgi:hypothetical protein